MHVGDLDHFQAVVPLTDPRPLPAHATPEQAQADAEARVTEALRRGDGAAADTLVKQLLRSSAKAPRSWALDSDVGLAFGDVKRSLASAEMAIARGASSTQDWLRLARSLRNSGRWREAALAVDSARAAADNAGAHAMLGDYYVQLEDFPSAEAAYDQAVSLAPANARYLFNRAAIRRFLGEFAAAEQDYDRAIELDPCDAEAWLNRADLRIQTPARNHVRELQDRVTRGFNSWQSEVPIRFALAKELEDLGDHARSWTQLTAGAALRRRHLKYDPTTDLASVDWIIEAFPKISRPDVSFGSAAPIFIVGMPRTGTTLLERILGGCPDVRAAGELHHFAAAVVAAAHRKAGRADLSRRELVAVSSTVDFAALGADYIERTSARTTGHARFTDKMPLNYLYCGLIRRALPNARILHLTRHPLATCYAVFKVLFHQGYPFSYDLEELADYYIGYRRLMVHWHQTLPGQILDVSYERLVTEPQSEAKRVLDFCGLEWNARVLEITERSAPSTTASAVQVRRAIYASSIDLWKHYANGLRPVADKLQAAGLNF